MNITVPACGKAALHAGKSFRSSPIPTPAFCGKAALHADKSFRSSPIPVPAF